MKLKNEQISIIIQIIILWQLFYKKKQCFKEVSLHQFDQVNLMKKEKVLIKIYKSNILL